MVPALVTRRPEIGFHVRDLFPERHGFTVMVGSGRPLSRGHILLRSADPTMHPLIYPEYFSEPEDLHALMRSVQRMRNIMRGLAIRELIEAELAPGPIANDETSIEADIRARCATYFHPSGTCRMGPKRPPSSIHGYASTASRACVLRTLRSCRQHSMRVHMHRRS
jgi:choline dehydrogenase